MAGIFNSFRAMGQAMGILRSQTSTAMPNHPPATDNAPQSPYSNRDTSHEAPKIANPAEKLPIHQTPPPTNDRSTATALAAPPSPDGAATTHHRASSTITNPAVEERAAYCEEKETEVAADIWGGHCDGNQTEGSASPAVPPGVQASSSSSAAASTACGPAPAPLALAEDREQKDTVKEGESQNENTKTYYKDGLASGAGSAGERESCDTSAAASNIIEPAPETLGIGFGEETEVQEMENKDGESREHRKEGSTSGAAVRMVLGTSAAAEDLDEGSGLEQSMELPAEEAGGHRASSQCSDLLGTGDITSSPPPPLSVKRKAAFDDTNCSKRSRKITMSGSSDTVSSPVRESGVAFSVPSTPTASDAHQRTKSSPAFTKQSATPRKRRARKAWDTQTSVFKLEPPSFPGFAPPIPQLPPMPQQALMSQQPLMPQQPPIHGAPFEFSTMHSYSPVFCMTCGSRTPNAHAMECPQSQYHAVSHPSLYHSYPIAGSYLGFGALQAPPEVMSPVNGYPGSSAGHDRNIFQTRPQNTHPGRYQDLGSIAPSAMLGAAGSQESPIVSQSSRHPARGSNIIINGAGSVTDLTTSPSPRAPHYAHELGPPSPVGPPFRGAASHLETRGFPGAGDFIRGDAAIGDDGAADFGGFELTEPTPSLLDSIDWEADYEALFAEENDAVGEMDSSSHNL